MFEKLGTLDRQLGKRPKQVVFCKRCVVSNQRPRITIGKDGVCSACRYAEEKHSKIDWEKREGMLWELLDQHRSHRGDFDVVVPGSGGKDSVYVSHMLKYKYKMNPFCVCWAPFDYTEIGFENFKRWTDEFPVIQVWPNRKLHRKMSRLAFELLGDAWEPFAYGQKNLAMNIALKFDIPLIFYGESGEVEYGGSTSSANVPFESPDDWRKLYYKGSSFDELYAIGLDSGWIKRDDYRSSDKMFYQTPPKRLMDDLGVRMHWFSFYEKWIPQENYYYASETTGFKANPQRSEGTYSKYASLDDRQDGFHFYLSFIKFGIARATSDASHEIRDGHITRDEAVALVQRYDGEFPAQHMRWFLDYLNMTEEDFFRVIDKYRHMSPHLWAMSPEGWVLKHTVWGEPKICAY